MNKLGYCIAALLFLYVRAYGQASYYIEDPHMTFKGGAILGANFTQVDGDSYYGYHKVGLNAGGTVYVHFTPLFGISMELLYTQKGSRGVTVAESPYVGTYVEKYNMDLNYVEVPLLLHLTTSKIDFEAGASYSYLIKSSEYVLTDVPVNISPTANAFKKTDLSYIAGGTVKIYKQLYLNGRFQYSMNSIRDQRNIPQGFSYGNGGQFNNIVSLRLIYMF